MNAYIVAGYRTAIGKAPRGAFRFTRPEDLGTAVIKHLLEKTPNFDPSRVEDVIVGNAIPEGEQGLNMARYISLLSLGKEVPGVTVNRYCASGLETIVMAAAKIHAGLQDAVIAGGAESMSLIPMPGYRVLPNYHIAKDYPEYYFGMGLTSEAVSREYGVTREDCDAFALRSHQRALNAIEQGYFKDQIVPFEVEHVYLDQDQKKQTETYTVDTDEGPRRDTSLERLAKLRPVFSADGVTTAGNSSQTNDGAAFVLVVSEKVLKEFKLEPIAQIKGYNISGVEPRIMGIGPKVAIPKALEQAGLKKDDLDVIELNEAFATQSLAVVRSLELDEEKVNPNGGAIALGHPLGCSGAKLSVQVINEVQRRGGKYGMVTACVGGGQGIAGVYEVFGS